MTHDEELEKAIDDAWNDVVLVTPASLAAHAMAKTLFRVAFLRGATWKRKRIIESLLAGLFVISCGGAGASNGAAQPQTLPAHCETFVQTARACIAQQPIENRSELEWTLQSTIEMWQREQREGMPRAELDRSCEQATGWGTDLAYCPEGS